MAALLLATFTTGSTILSWYKEYKQGFYFRQDQRGLAEPPWILDQLSIQVDEGIAVPYSCVFTTWCKENLKKLSVKKAHEFITKALLANVDRDTMERFGLSTVTESTVYRWMGKCGCLHGPATKGYYVDGHEKEENVKYRKVFVERHLAAELQQPLWVQMTKAAAEELKGATEEKGGKLPNYHDDPLSFAGGYTFKRDDEILVEYHVDDSDAFLPLREKFKLGGNFSVRFPQGEPPLLAMGQDESIYKAFQLPAGSWSCGGRQVIRPKTDGKGLQGYETSRF